MSWHWRLEDPAGAAVDPASLGVEVPVTDNQGDAESWLGENWRDLLDKGVATVTLFNPSPSLTALPLARCPRADHRRGGGR